MTAGVTWYKRNPADFIGGTAGMSLEEKGAYSLLLDTMYLYGGPIADDPRHLAGLCNVSVRRWNSIRQRLLDLGKIVLIDGRLINHRVSEEIAAWPPTRKKAAESHAKPSRKLAETSANGADKSAEIEADANKNNDLSRDTRAREIRERREEKREERKKDAASGDAAPSSHPVPSGLVDPRPVDPETDYYRRGKELLGQRGTGGILTNLLRAKGGVAKARAALETASTKQDPREYVIAASRKPRDPYRDDDDEIYRGVL